MGSDAKNEGVPSKRSGVSRRGFLKGAAAGSGVVAAADLGALSGLAGAASATIADENSLAGALPSEWDIDPDPSIEGFATQFSVNAGQTIQFKVRTNSTSYRIDIYRLGWYGGRGARKVVSINPSVPLPQSQPAPLADNITGLVDCSNWAVSASWAVPASAVSGVYVANLNRLDSSASNRILFVVRNDGRQSDVLVQTSDTTYQAYNTWGGNSLYSGSATYGRATKVSYNRPLGNHGLENEFWYAEYPLVRWLERNGYDVSYFADIDSHQRPAELLNHRVFISSGHDEYWSKAQRANVEAARDAGVNLVFMTGNEVFWKVRWEPGADGAPDRTMVCYKETLANAKIDPNPEWTGTWRDKRFTPPSDGGRPENGLTGTLFRAINPNNDPDFSIKVPYEYSRLRIWRNTSVASLPVGGSATFPVGTLGYEWNTDEDNGARPAGLIRMSQTTETAAQVLVDNGGTYVSSPLTHYITMYKAASGARVFSTGTVQWSWGLDGTHQNSPSVPVPTNADMQQATLNVLADMGAQPVTRQSGLVAATASTDTLPPAAVIASPANGGSVTIGSPITVTGTASDSGGGRVAAVEVSVDGGNTWHPATGTTGWSYTFTPVALGPIEVRARAVDDSCNIQTALASVSLTGTPRPLPASLWSNAAVPAQASANDTSAVELGLKFRVDTDGFITGIRFYKGAGNTGTHTGRLWTATGTELASVTFAAETATGWQQAMFQRPVPVVAGTTYVASYFAPVGRYAADVGYFSSTYNLPPLRALANGEDGPNGVFRGGSTGFPTDTYGATNYWVDVVFDTDDHLAPTVVDRSPATDLEAVTTAAVVTARFSEAMTASSVQLQLAGPNAQPIAGTTAYDAASRTATFTPTAALAAFTRYTATVTSARDVSGQSISGPVSWSFTTAGAAGATSTSLWDTSAVPAVASVNDPNAVEVGMKFTSDIGGTVRSVRFYKGSANVGTHLGHLWDAAGTLLGTATFANESATGWQQANLVAPVTITAGATYVVSVYMPNGGYAATSGGFGSSVDRAPLHGLRSASAGGNGVFRYGAGGGFPTGSYGDANYWVDLMFDRPADTTAPTLVNREPAPNLQGVAANTAVVASFSEPIDGSSLAFSLKGPGGSTIPATVTYDGPTRTARLTPNAPLAAGALYSASVSAKDSVGNPMPSPDTWGFATAVPVGQTPATIWDTSAVPAVISANDTAAVELGVKFRSDVDGAISGLRFFKGLGNEGPHVGRLWTAGGVLLGQVGFTNETATGWQQANFASPVPVTANTTYVASYHAPTGRYSHTGGGFTSAVDRVPLHALSSSAAGGNGVYAYGAGGFPTGTFGAANYWVDVVFVDTAGPNVIARTPQPGSTDATTSTTVTATFDEPVSGGLVMELRDQGGIVVAGSVAYNSITRTGTFTPSAALRSGQTYTATVSGARDALGNAMSAPVSWSFAVGVAGAVSLFAANSVPAVAAANDSGAVELGMKFRATVAGSVTGVRFYKGAANTGTHVGRLYTAAGVLLGSVIFTGETASGWQTANFSSPVPITPNTTYIVSYHAPVGRYSVNGAFFNPGDVVNGPLVGRGNYSNDRNGTYRYGPGGTVPTSSFNGSNYWVDVVFRPS